MSDTEVLGAGKFLRLVRQAGWEFVERPRQIRAVFIGALTDDGYFLLTKEYRVPVGKIVVGCCAGLVGDIDDNESLETAVKRELLEEAGYETQRVTFLTEGPTSPGLTSEVIAIVLAEGLRKVAAGGGIEGEKIEIHPVLLAEIDGWLHHSILEGCVIDPKVYTILYFISRRHEREGLLRGPD